MILWISDYFPAKWPCWSRRQKKQLLIPLNQLLLWSKGRVNHVIIIASLSNCWAIFIYGEVQASVLPIKTLSSVLGIFASKQSYLVQWGILLRKPAWSSLVWNNYIGIHKCPGSMSFRGILFTLSWKSALQFSFRLILRNVCIGLHTFWNICLREKRVYSAVDIISERSNQMWNCNSLPISEKVISSMFPQNWWMVDLFGWWISFWIVDLQLEIQ